MKEIVPSSPLSVDEMQFRLVGYGYDYATNAHKISAALKNAGVSDITPRRFTPTFVQFEIHLRSTFFGNPFCDCDIEERDGQAVLRYRLNYKAPRQLMDSFWVCALSLIVSVAVFYLSGRLRAQSVMVVWLAGATAIQLFCVLCARAWILWKFGSAVEEKLRRVLADSDSRWRRWGAA
ncbi:MAG: hypothetical protein ABJB74_04050 [Gemmatimonas sp.]